VTQANNTVFLIEPLAIELQWLQTHLPSFDQLQQQSPSSLSLTTVSLEEYCAANSAILMMAAIQALQPTSTMMTMTKEHTAPYHTLPNAIWNVLLPLTMPLLQEPYGEVLMCMHHVAQMYSKGGW